MLATGVWALLTFLVVMVAALKQQGRR